MEVAKEDWMDLIKKEGSGCQVKDEAENNNQQGCRDSRRRLDDDSSSERVRGSSGVA